MKATFFAVAASLLSAVSAGPVHERGIAAVHKNLHALKPREESANASPAECDACTTYWKTIVYTEEPTPVPSTSSVVTSLTPVPETTSTVVPPASSAPAPSSQAVESPAAAPSSSSSSNTNTQANTNNKSQGKTQSSSSQISTGGDLYAMSYTPYKGTSPGNSRCAEADEVKKDIAAIATKGFKVVRTYATDCNGLQHIGDAVKASGLKMIVGVFVDGSGVDSPEVDHQISDIKSYFNGDYSVVEMVLFGNEVLFNNFASASALASKLASVKQELKAAGYNGHVSTADTLATLQEHEGTLCDSMDVLAANIHPFFNDATSALGAGAFVSQQMDSLKGLCGGSKKAINSETGWPNNGESNGAAIPSTAEQLIAIESIKKAVGGLSVFFSFENDLWKASGYKNVENAWGCADVFHG